MRAIGGRTAFASLATALLACTSTSSDAPASHDDGGADVLVSDAPLAPDVDPKVRADAQAACGRKATAYCAKLGICYPPYVTTLFGSQASCEAAFAIACTPSLLAPGSTTTPSEVDACVQALPGADCAALFGTNDPPPPCRTKSGMLADGARCGFDTQCVGAYCANASDGCGRCSSPAASGDACSETNGCAHGLVCAQGACIAPRGVNETCNARVPCTIPLLCEDGNCVQPLGVDAPCSAAADACDVTAGLSCDAPMCAPFTFTPRGRCGRMADGTLVVCAGAECTFDSVQGFICVPPAAYGSACIADGPSCAAPSACVGGRCTLRTEATCL